VLHHAGRPCEARPTGPGAATRLQSGAVPTSSTASPSLRLFGAPALRVGDGSRGLPATAPSWLLATLALAGDWFARERLALLFWPDAGTADAQRQLRVTLHRSRQLLAGAGCGEALVAERSRVRLALASDVGAFREALSRGEHAAALALQAAPLLDGQPVRGFAALDGWLQDQREALRDGWRRAARAQAEALERQGDAAGAFALLRRQLTDDDLLAEDTVQALLRVAPAGGDRAAALALFERFRARAADELGLPPLPQTLALAEALRRAAPLPPPAAPAAAPGPRPPVLDRPPMLGRDEALALLRRPRAGLTVVEGEPGLGKTRLLQAALAAAAAPVLWVTAREALQPAPLQALADALAAQADTLAAMPLPRSCRQALAWLPLSRGETDAGVRGPLDPQAPDLHAAVATVLRAWPGPVAIDDLPWLDDDSLAVLAQALQGRDATGDTAWLATRRPGEGSPALQDWLATLADEGRLHTLDLPPLPAAAVAALAEAAAGVALPRLGAWLAARCGGNPLFVIESLRHLHEDGRLDPRRAGWHAALEALADAPPTAVPPRAAGLVRRRLQRLDEATQRVLRVAAVAGDAEALDTLAELAGLSPWAAAEGLGHAQAAGLLTGRRFAHDLVREVLVGDLPEPVRALLHAGIARRLAARLGPHQRAAHWWAAGETAEALDATLQAAQLDGERGLLAAAERLLAATAERLGPAPAPALDTARLAVARAFLARQRLDLDAAEHWCREALAQLPQPATRQAALVEAFELALWRGRLTEAAAHLAEAQAIDPERPTLWLDAAKLAHAQGDAAGCAALTARYVQWLRRRPPGAELAGALTSQGVALDLAGEHAAAVPLHEEALAIARRIRARYAELEAAGNLVFCLGELGRDADAVRVGLPVLAGDEEVFNAPLAANVAYSLMVLDRLDEAEHWYRRVHAAGNASAACAAAGKLLELAARRAAPPAALAAAVDAVFEALARTEVWSVQAGALVAVLTHGTAADAARVRPWLRDEPLYPGLQQRLDAALARHATPAEATATGRGA